MFLKAIVAVLTFPFAAASWIAGKSSGKKEDSPLKVAQRVMDSKSWELPEPKPGESLGEKIDKALEDAEFPRIV